MRAFPLATVGLLIWGVAAIGAEPRQMRIRISWGHHAAVGPRAYVALSAEKMELSDVRGVALEDGDRVADLKCRTRSGGGDVDGVSLTIRFEPMEIKPPENLHIIWADLMRDSDAATRQRLSADLRSWKDPRRLTITLNEEGTRGFTVTADQLLTHNAIWIPSIDMYIATGDAPVAFSEHEKDLAVLKGRRVLDRIHAEPEATYEQYKSRWDDMGSPAYKHPSQPEPGHIVCLSWESGTYKFGVDRFAGVRNDLGSPDRFRQSFELPNAQGQWRSQRLVNGLPIIVTNVERDGERIEVKQFVYPLHAEEKDPRNGPMVLMQEVSVRNDTQDRTSIVLPLGHERVLPVRSEVKISGAGPKSLVQTEDGRSLLLIEGSVNQDVVKVTRRPVDQKSKREEWCAIVAPIALDIPAGETRKIIIKLPSPVVEPNDRDQLARLDFDQSLANARKYWESWLAKGAQFEVPEPAVNERFRANLWHALRLPRRHGTSDQLRIDLPYSNFAYGQQGIPWPINQGVYVDYMLYALRGYHNIAAEELEQMYVQNQEANGHIRGYANWGVYTPSMLYVVAKNYRLSGDKAALDRLLPPTMKAMDWCLSEVSKAKGGLIQAPLNDLTGEGVWAFSQAYIYAGLAEWGIVLKEIGHPRAAECLKAAGEFREAIVRGFGAAMVRSPLVQLRDGTWTPYVPSEAHSPGRRFDQWYVTDADTGSMHLARLKALRPVDEMTEALLEDHEDNLYLHGWGMANEPVYNPQATVYLLRDDPKAIIRQFYSYMACAFSHSVHEPVEHRWTWGQYFGPPSTDGAWFELYRNMLIRELDDGSLMLLQATPRKWLEHGKQIEVKRAPTYFGDLSMKLDSAARDGTIRVDVEMPSRAMPRSLVVRVRHPEGQSIQSATVNGQEWREINPKKEWVSIPRPTEKRYSILVRFAEENR